MNIGTTHFNLQHPCGRLKVGGAEIPQRVAPFFLFSKCFQYWFKHQDSFYGDTFLFFSFFGFVLTCKHISKPTTRKIN